MAPLFDSSFVLFLLCFFAAQGNGKKQREAMDQFFRANKLHRKSSNFYANNFQSLTMENVDEVEILPQDGLKEGDEIKALPGQPDVGFAQYGGYVTVNATAGRALFYYFVEAENSSAKHSLPLLLWLNGGPGCSSLGYGAMEELGPFRVHSDGKTLYLNEFAWNKAANVLFLESPAGVGFSYSNSSSDYEKGGDRRTADDNYVFLLNWLERFPEYKDRQFFISGESYAGHFVPQLAHSILHHNHKSNRTIINLKGIMIGNPTINEETDEQGAYEYLGSHALASNKAISIIQKYCNFLDDASASSSSQFSKDCKAAAVGNNNPSEECEAADRDEECNAAYSEVDKDTENINIFSIYAPLCHVSRLSSSPVKASVITFDPCTDDYVYAYMNQREVQEAFHANITKLRYRWDFCSDVLTSWEDSPSTTLPLLRELMANGLRVWIFSGDTDGRVPVTSTKLSINKMELPVETSWKPWILHGEVGGYTQVYKGKLTFATVRGAGHEVPSYQPERALILARHFLAGTPLCTI